VLKQLRKTVDSNRVGAEAILFANGGAPSTPATAAGVPISELDEDKIADTKQELKCRAYSNQPE
jgi:hypothetical protein